MLLKFNETMNFSSSQQFPEANGNKAKPILTKLSNAICKLENDWMQD